MSRRAGVLARYAEWLPLTSATPALDLGEGSTPLLAAPRLARHIGVRELHLKVEGLNPTGSFKDRGMVVAVAKAAEEGARAVLCASTGNTSASAAAYAARAGMRALVLLPKGKVAAGKLAQAIAYGAEIVAIDGNFDDALTLARAVAEEGSAALVNSVNPHRIAGQTTGAFEVCDALGTAPDVLALPVGNGGNITAYWLGFRRYHERDIIPALPRILGAQAAGAAPFVHGAPVAQPETVATAIRIGNPATWQPALDAARESHGSIRAVTDEQILAAYRAVARMEGVFCEPASAAGIAALQQAVQAGSVSGDSLCVCVLTGNGLKDPDTAVAQSAEPRVIAAHDRATLQQLLA